MELNRLNSALATLSEVSGAHPKIRLQAYLQLYALLPETPHSSIIERAVKRELDSFLDTIRADALNEASVPQLIFLCDFLSMLKSQRLLVERQYHRCIEKVTQVLAEKWIWLGEPDRAIKLLFPESGGWQTDRLKGDDPVARSEALLQLLPRPPLLESWLPYRRPRRETPRTFLRKRILTMRRFLTQAKFNSAPLLLVDDIHFLPPLGFLSGLKIAARSLKSDSIISTPCVSIQPKPSEDDRAAKDALTNLERYADIPCRNPQSKRCSSFELTCDDNLMGCSFGATAAALIANSESRTDRRWRQTHLRSSAVVTAGIDEDGNLTPIDETGLSAKITRVFFSPLSTVFVHNQQQETARTTTLKLRESFPYRNLTIATAESISELHQDGRFSLPMDIYAVSSYFATLFPRLIAPTALALFSFLLVWILFLTDFPTINRLISESPAYVSMTPIYPNRSAISVYNGFHRWIWRYYPHSGDVDWWDIQPKRSNDIRCPDAEIVDWNDDGSMEVVYVSQEGTPDPSVVKIIDKNQQVLVNWRIPTLELPPSVNLTKADYPWVRIVWSVIRWQEDSRPHVILALHRSDHERDWNGWCALGETDLEGSSFQRLFFKKEWWRNLVVSPCGVRNYLWASTHTPDGSPVLTIFKNGIPDGSDWQSDTSIVSYRFPVDPLWRHFLSRAYIKSINVDKIIGRDNGIKICGENLSDSIAIGYRIAKNGEYRWPEYSLDMWHKRLDFARSHGVELSMNREEFAKYMNHPQLWNGQAWIPLDDQDILPDSAYSIYSMSPSP